MDCNYTKCLIVEDEPHATALLKNFLERLPSFEVAGECKTAFEAMEVLKREKIDLIFLDIHLPGYSGLEFLKSIPNHPYVIITTAYPEYALDGYDLDIIDFLLKPIMIERFMKAIYRYCERTKIHSSENIAKPGDSYEKNYILLHEGKDLFKVFIHDILYLEAFGEYVKVFAEDRKYLVRKALSEFESELPDDVFLRVHKSYLINIQKVTGFSTIHVIMKNVQLPVGRMHREEVFRILKTGK
jgi:two-component system, LytTR family, response regulator